MSTILSPPRSGVVVTRMSRFECEILVGVPTWPPVVEETRLPVYRRKAA